MKKRVLSLCMAFILSFSMMPMTALAQKADVVAEQGDPVESIVESVSNSDAGMQDTAADDEKKAAVQKVQALIDALPETVTVENAESVSVQLEAIDEAMESLTEEQIAELDMTRLHAISEAMNALMTVAEQHTHCICGKDHHEVGEHTEESVTTFTQKLWMDGDTLKIDDEAVQISSNISNKAFSGIGYVLPTGSYYLGNDVQLKYPLYFGDSENRNVNLCLNGKTITANGDFDAIILYRGYGYPVVFSLTDCQNTGKITHSNGKSGCGVYVFSNSRATFNMYKGSIDSNAGHVTTSNSTTTINGGGVSMNNNSSYSGDGGIFKMYGGTITNNSATNGGGVYMCNNVGNIFRMYGGSITDNTATGMGGGVYSAGGEITMTGGTINHNKAPQGGGMYESGGSSVFFTMSGGSITGNNATGKGGGVYVSKYGNFKISGSVQITGNTKDGAANNVELAAGKTITIQSDLADGASIGVTTEKKPGTGDYSKVASSAEGYSLTEADANHFFSDVDHAYTIMRADNKLILTNTGDSTLHYHPICGKTCTHTNADGTFQHKDVYWEATSTLTKDMPAGYYYLTQDVTLTQSWNPADGMVLDLNGFDIIMNANDYVISKYTSGTFTLTDCMGGKDTYGKITHGNNYQGGGIELFTTGSDSYTNSFVMYGGSITGNTGSFPGVYLRYNSYRPRTFTMYGGEITNNTNQSNTGSYKGGGVYVAAGNTFTMTGGKITGNQTATYGGGVYVEQQSNFIVSGDAQITGNSKTNGTTDNVYLQSVVDGTQKQASIQVKGALSVNASIGVSAGTIDAGSNKIVAQGSKYTLTNDDLKAFTSDSSYTKKLLDNGIIFINGDLHEHGICGKEGCNEAGHGNAAWIGVSKLDEITSAGYYYLKNDITLNANWEPADGVVLCLNGNSIKAASNLESISVKNTFTLTDCKGKDGSNYGQITNKTNIKVLQSGNFYFYGGSITGNSVNTNLSTGVIVWGNFYMHGGEIVNNTTTGKGGGVYLAKTGRFTMTGGRIANNSAKEGGGVYVDSDTITVSSAAQITGNKVVSDDRIASNNVYLPNGKKITVGGALNDSASIGVTSEAVPDDSTPVTIATAADNWIKDGNFTADNSLYKVNVSADGKTVNLGLHEHQWKVRVKTGSENILEEYCDVAGCTTVGGTLTLDAENQKYSGKAYDSAKVITVDNWTQAIPTEGEIFYTDSENKQLTDAPVKASTYYANVTVDGVTAKKKFTISRWKLDSGDIEYTAPDQDSLIYDGSRKEATVKATKPGVGEITVTYYNEVSEIVDPINAGTYTVRIEVAESDGFEGDTLTNTDWKFTIAPKPVTITSISAQNKEYDGNTNAVITGTPEINGLVAGDVGDVTVVTTNAKATFADADAGTAKKVTFTGYALTGAKAGNYILSAQPASVTAAISPKALAITDVTVGAKPYDGTTTATVTGVTFNGLVNSESLTKDKDYTVTGNFVDVAVGDNKDVIVTVNLKDSVKNYTLSNTENTKNGCKIVKAAVAAPAVRDLTIINGNTTIYTVMLPQLLPSLVLPQQYGSLTYDEPQLTITDNSYQGTAEVRSGIEYGKLALKFTQTGNTEGPIGTITVTVHSENYEDITLKFNIKATAKIVPQLEGTLKLTPSDITYGEKLSHITISGTMTANGRKITGTFTWQNADTVLNVGNQEATWKFTPDDTQTYAETTGTTTVRVNKAEQSGAVLMDNYTYNETPKTPALTERKGDNNAAVTYYYSTTRTNSGGTEWKDITPTTLKAGTYYMYAVIGETGNYKAYTTEAKEFTVWKAAPVYTKPSGLTAKYGQKLSEIALPNPAGNMPGTWSWNAPDTVIDKTGTVKYDTYFTPDDTNYKKVVGAAIEITVARGDGRNLATEELTLAFNDSADHTYTPDWSELPAGQTWNYECGSSIGSGSNAKFTKLNVSAADGGLTYAVSDGQVGDKITVILKACCSNYKDFTITLHVQITKAAPAGEPKYTLITTEGKTLADAGLTLNGSTLNPADGTLEWVGTDGNVLPDDTEVKVNTTYKWRFTPADTNYNSLTGEIELYHVDAPAISAQPKSVSVTVGEKATFEVTATGTDVTYQWKINRNDGNGFVDITGATGAAYTTGVTDKDCDGFKYQCVIRNAAGSVTTDTVVLTVKEKLYEIIDGANSSWTQSTDGSGSIRIRGNGEISKFVNVKVDGTIVDPANYTVTEGSTIIELKADYLKTLSEGTHTFEIIWTDGTAGTSFTVAKNTSDAPGNNDNNKDENNDNNGNNNGNDSNNGNNNGSNNAGNNGISNTAGNDNTVVQILDVSPNTGDASGIWIALFVVSAVGLAVMLVRRKKQ